MLNLRITCHVQSLLKLVQQVAVHHREPGLRALHVDSRFPQPWKGTGRLPAGFLEPWEGAGKLPATFPELQEGGGKLPSPFLEPMLVDFRAASYFLQMQEVRTTDVNSFLDKMNSLSDTRYVFPLIKVKHTEHIVPQM